MQLGRQVRSVFAGALFGALIVGRRADRHPNPLALYARLELGIALLALASPWTVAAARYRFPPFEKAET